MRYSSHLYITLDHLFQFVIILICTGHYYFCQLIRSCDVKQNFGHAVLIARKKSKIALLIFSNVI